MAYVTQQELVDRFGEQVLIHLTDRDNTGAIDAVVVARAIADAASLADSYLAKVVKLPLGIIPAALGKISADLAFYYLHGESAEKDTKVTRDYANAIAWLRDVSKGIVQLDVGGEAPAPAGGGSVKAVAPNRVFTRDSLRGF